jgi:NADPH:quinone reductase-like Zn-dependent oxidoreductase
VTGVCSTTTTEIVRSIGAEHVIDYTREDFADRRNRYDVILDIPGTAGCHRSGAPSPPMTLVIVGGEGGGKWLIRYLREGHARGKVVITV